MADICCVCTKPILDGEPRDGRYLVEGKTAHWRCSTKPQEAEQVFKAQRRRLNDFYDSIKDDATERARQQMQFKEIIEDGSAVVPIVTYSASSSHGRSQEWVVCPFCLTHTLTYIWSRAGGGKRCDCGVLLARYTAIKAADKEG